MPLSFLQGDFCGSSLLQATSASFFLEALLLCPRWHPGWFARGRAAERLLQEFHEALQRGLSVCSLAAAPLGDDPEDSLLAHTSGQSGEDAFFLAGGKARRIGNMEPEHHPGAGRVGVPASWTAAARGGEFQLLLGYGNFPGDTNHWSLIIPRKGAT